MKRGRKPKPSQLKTLAGNPGGRPFNDREPRPPVPAHTPRAPRWLGAEAKKVWRHLAPILRDLGLYSTVDRYALAMLCNAAGRWIQAEKDLAKQDLVLSGAEGGQYQNPLLHVANKAWEQIRRLAPEFGLTPSSRARLPINPLEGEKSIAEQLFEAATDKSVKIR